MFYVKRSLFTALHQVNACPSADRAKTSPPSFFLALAWTLGHDKRLLESPSRSFTFRQQRWSIGNNRQNGANHIHSVWRDVENDFASDVMREHLLMYHVL